MKSTAITRRVIGLGLPVVVATCLTVAGPWVNLANVHAQENSVEGQSVLALAEGETLRVIGISNDLARQTGAARLAYEVYGTDGTRLFQSPRMEIPRGGIAFGDVTRADLDAPGDPGTRRLQVRVVVHVALPGGGQPRDFVLLAEIYDTLTGKTTTRVVMDVLYSAAGNSGD